MTVEADRKTIHLYRHTLPQTFFSNMGLLKKAIFHPIKVISPHWIRFKAFNHLKSQLLLCWLFVHMNKSSVVNPCQFHSTGLTLNLWRQRKSFSSSKEWYDLISKQSPNIIKLTNNKYGQSRVREKPPLCTTAANRAQLARLTVMTKILLDQTLQVALTLLPQVPTWASVSVPVDSFSKNSVKSL